MVSFGELPELMRHDRGFAPAAGARETYDALFEVYRDLHKRLAPLYRRLHRID